jgi:hypothetical protein
MAEIAKFGPFLLPTTRLDSRDFKTGKIAGEDAQKKRKASLILVNFSS